MAISCNTKPYLTPKTQALATGLAFLTGHYVRAALATGALGYVVKDRLATDLGTAINEARAGRSYVLPSIAP